MKTFVVGGFAKLFSLLTGMFPYHRVRMSAWALLIQERETSPILKLSVTAGMGLQLMLKYLALFFSVCFQSLAVTWAWITKIPHAHSRKKKKNQPLFSMFPAIKSQILCLFWPPFQAALVGLCGSCSLFKEGSLGNHHLESSPNLLTA